MATDVLVPRIYWEYTTPRLLVMEFMDGIKVTDVEALQKAGIDTRAVAQKLTDAYLQQILLDGLFHADPHPGNLACPSRPAPSVPRFWLDERPTAGISAEMARLTTAIVPQNSEAIVASFRRLGFVTKKGGDESLLVLGRGDARHSVKENKSYADPEWSSTLTLKMA